MVRPTSITRLLIDWSNGNRGALDELTPHVYRELHALARTYLSRERRNQTLQPTALINEVYIRLIDQPQKLQYESRSHFYGIAARLMRQILVDHTRTSRAAKRGGGAVLYEILTGQRAQHIDTHSPSEIAHAICHREPKKPSTLAKHLDKDLDNIVLKALRKEPARRYASVEELSQDLERFLHDQPVKARNESVLYRGRKFLKRHRLPSIAAVLGAVLVLALIWGLGLFRSASPVVQSIAVLPLENLTHDPDQEYLAEGITDALIRDLAKMRSLRVISRTSVMRYRNVARDAARIARDLNVNTLVEGSIQRFGNRVQVSLQLKTGDMKRVFWTQTYSRDLQELPALQSDAALAIAREVHVRLTPQEEALATRGRPVSQKAHETYLRGQYQLYKHTQSGFKSAIEHFNEAINIDPAYAPAWAALADGYYEMSSVTLPASEAMPKARAAAQRALAIDPTLPEPYATLAQIQAQYDWDWTASEANLKRALELNPSYAQGHYYYGYDLAQQGRMDEAIREMAEAYKFDPLTPRRATNLAWTYYLARRIDEAIAQNRKILEVDPGTPIAHYTLGLAYEQKGMFKEAESAFLMASTLDVSPAWLHMLGHLYASCGKTDQARNALDRLLKLTSQRHVDAYLFGVVHLGLGETDKAFEWFEKAFQARSEELLFLKVDPRLDKVRADQRYKGLVRRIGLPLD